MTNNLTENWVKLIGASGYENVFGGTAVNQIGDLYVTGNQTFGGIDELVNNHIPNSFLFKYDSNGNEIWSKFIGSIDQHNACSDIDLDQNGYVYITGQTK